MPEQTTLRRLIYRSRSRIACGPIAVATELGSILATSRRRNTESRLTGALMLREMLFAQVLEGPEAAIGATFARISADARHHAVEILEDAACVSRVFGDWTMAYAGEFGMPDIPLSLSLNGTILNEAQTALLDRLRAAIGNT